MSKQMIWAGQGPVYFGTYDATAGTPEMGYLTHLFKVGCANSALTTTPKRETKTVKESCSGQRLDIAEIETGKSLDVKLDMHQFDQDTLARAFFGAASSEVAGTVTAENFPLGLVAGGYVFLKRPGASTLVLTDSNATPVTLVEGTHYKVVDAAQGVIQMVSVATLTQPIKAAYSYAAYGNIAAFTATSVKTGILFTGINQDGDRARVVIPKVSLAMSGDFSWIGNEESVLSLGGPAFYVPELAADPLFGPFMRIDALPSA
jgi:hypothetical protein